MFTNQALKSIKFRHYIPRNIALSSYLQDLSHNDNWRRSVMKKIIWYVLIYSNWTALGGIP